MTVNLYKTSSDPRMLSKALTAVGSYACKPYRDASVTTPQILLRVDSAALSGINYMYIPDFGRYYWVTDVTFLTGGRAVVSGSVDVLMTYAAGIRGLGVNIDRAQGQTENYIPDTSQGFTNSSETTVYKSADPLLYAETSTCWMVLGVIGKPTATPSSS